jgi:hypothetical protein
MRALHRVLTAGLAFVACSATARLGQAQAGSPLTLVWAAPEICPQEAAFRANVERFLRQSLSERREQVIAIAGTVRETSPGDFQLLLQVGTARGNQRRELSHRDCRELAEAGALVTALAIDPNLVLESDTKAIGSAEPASAATAPVGVPPAPARPALQALPKQASRTAPAVRPRSSSSISRLHPSLLALGFAGNAALPDVGTGFGARAAAGPDRFRLVVRGIYWLERFLPVSEEPGPGVDLSAWAIGLRACGLPTSSSVSLWACVGVDTGQLKANGRALDRRRTARERWTGLTAELAAVHVASSGLTTHLGFELGRALELPRFGVTFDGLEREVFEANTWIAQASVGVGFSFGRHK